MIRNNTEVVTQKNAMRIANDMFSLGRGRTDV